MLVLTRKIGSRIIINDQIIVQVVQVKGRQVRLGIEAPRETKIYREEIYRSLKSKEQKPDQLKTPSQYLTV